MSNKNLWRILLSISIVGVLEFILSQLSVIIGLFSVSMGTGGINTFTSSVAEIYTQIPLLSLIFGLAILIFALIGIFTTYKNMLFGKILIALTSIYYLSNMLLEKENNLSTFSFNLLITVIFVGITYLIIGRLKLFAKVVD
ncbi:MAG: hypothetical protein WCG48_03990 [Candidatus Berkelbacteria bacterium]